MLIILNALLMAPTLENERGLLRPPFMTSPIGTVNGLPIVDETQEHLAPGRPTVRGQDATSKNRRLEPTEPSPVKRIAPNQSPRG